MDRDEADCVSLEVGSSSESGEVLAWTVVGGGVVLVCSFTTSLPIALLAFTGNLRSVDLLIGRLLGWRLSAVSIESSLSHAAALMILDIGLVLQLRSTESTQLFQRDRPERMPYILPSSHRKQDVGLSDVATHVYGFDDRYIR